MKKLLILLLLTTASVGLFSNRSMAQAALTGINDESNYYKFATLVHDAKLDATLLALGTYTVFAPHNVLFRNMRTEKLDSLTKDADKLTMVLKAHIVKGKITKAEITKRLNAGKGSITLTNILGQPLKLTHTKDNRLVLSDAAGNKAEFLTFDTMDPHGVIHGIDNVLVVGK